MDGEVSIEDVYTAYYDCRKNKKNTLSAIEFEVSYEMNLHKLHKDINDRTYEIGRSICFVVTKPKLREVFAADFRDRIVHHLVIRKLEPLFEEYFIEDTYNCRVGKGVLYGIDRLSEKIRIITNDYTYDAWIGKFDCKGFFMSIHKPTLWVMLEKFITERYNEPDKELILWLTKKIVLHEPQKNCERHSPEYMWDRLERNKSLFTCDKDCGLPIGNLSSQMFANFYLTEFDRWMRGKFGGMYGRYVDDFYVLAIRKKDILDVIPAMKKMLEELHVVLHPKKVYIQKCDKGVRFTGGIVKCSRKYVNNKTVANMRRSISGFNKAENKEACLLPFTQSVNSYLGLLGQYRAYKIRKRELLRLSPDWFEYIYISGSYKKVVIKKKHKESYNLFKNELDMIRVTQEISKYVAVKKYNENRYRINFDMVPVIIDGEECGLATWSVQDYRKKPTTEEVQEYVKAATIKRYQDEGLEAPDADSIDVSEYVIE